jgi:hypothetical protein
MADDPMMVAFEKTGGVAGLVKWIKANGQNRGNFYTSFMSYIKRSAPLVQTNINNNVNVVTDEQARAKLYDSFARIISARKLSMGNPAVYVDGERLTDGYDYKATVNGERVDDGHPLLTDDAVTRDARPQPADAASTIESENLKSSQQGTVFADGGDLTTSAAEQKNKNSNYSPPRMPSPPGFAAGAALDGADDNLSASEKSYLCFGGRRWP